MTCEELEQLLPDLVDGTLAPELRAEAVAALAQCSDCQRELTIAREVRAFLTRLEMENVPVPAGFEARLLARVRRQANYLELLDLSSRSFAFWLLEFMNLFGGLLNSVQVSRR
jgi:anti-sigma factor RsiW